MDNAKIPSWPRSLARVNSRFAGRDIAVPVPCGQPGSGFVLRLEPSGLEFPGEWESATEAGQTELMLKVDGESWEIRAWGRVAEALLAPPAGLNPEDIPMELKPALLALALEPLLDRASQTMGHTLRLAGPHDSVPEHAVRERFTLPFTMADSAGNPAGAGQARIPLSAAALAVLADLAKAFPRRPAACCSALPLSLCLCAGRESFPLQILSEAEAGDVLRFAGPAKAPLTLEVNGRVLWTASLADGKMTIDGVLNTKPEEASMSVTPEDAVLSAAAPKAPGLSREDINALEIILTLVLDERRITLGELAVLGPGQILDTAASLEAPVTIKAGDKTVGKGRLVEVGGSLGVLIASLELGVHDRGRNTA